MQIFGDGKCLPAIFMVGCSDGDLMRYNIVSGMIDTNGQYTRQ